MKNKHNFTLVIGDEVEVPSPIAGDLHNFDFVGTIDSFRNGNIVVVDSEENYFEFEPHRLTLVRD